MDQKGLGVDDSKIGVFCNGRIVLSNLEVTQ